MQPEDVHREEGAVDPDEEQPELPAPKSLAEHSASHFRKPEVDGAEEREEHTADDHVMEVRDDEVRVVDLKVDRHGGDHHACEPANDEHDEEPDGEEHRYGQPRTPGVDRRDPA